MPLKSAEYQMGQFAPLLQDAGSRPRSGGTSLIREVGAVSGELAEGWAVPATRRGEKSGLADREAGPAGDHGCGPTTTTKVCSGAISMPFQLGFVRFICW